MIKFCDLATCVRSYSCLTCKYRLHSLCVEPSRPKSAGSDHTAKHDNKRVMSTRALAHVFVHSPSNACVKAVVRHNLDRACIQVICRIKKS